MAVSSDYLLVGTNNIVFDRKENPVNPSYNQNKSLSEERVIIGGNRKINRYIATIVRLNQTINNLNKIIDAKDRELEIKNEEIKDLRLNLTYCTKALQCNKSNNLKEKLAKNNGSFIIKLNQPCKHKKLREKLEEGYMVKLNFDNVEDFVNQFSIYCTNYSTSMSCDFTVSYDSENKTLVRDYGRF